MVHEFDPIEALFDEGASCTCHGPAEDKNVYVVGRFADHHTVLMMPGEEGELDAGMCTQRLRDRFRNIELTLLVGICGAMSQNFEADEPMFLGDVIVGTRVWRYLYKARTSQLGRYLHDTESNQSQGESSQWQSGGIELELRNLVTESTSQRVKQLGKLLMTEKFRKKTIDLSFFLSGISTTRKGRQVQISWLRERPAFQTRLPPPTSLWESHMRLRPLSQKQL